MNTEIITIKGRGEGSPDAAYTVYPRPLLFDFQIEEILGRPAADASAASTMLHWTRLGLIYAAEGLRPGRADLPPAPALVGADPGAWLAYAGQLADLFYAWGLTAGGLLRIRKASDALSDWAGELDAEGKS